MSVLLSHVSYLTYLDKLDLAPRLGEHDAKIPHVIGSYVILPLAEAFAKEEMNNMLFQRYHGRFE